MDNIHGFVNNFEHLLFVEQTGTAPLFVHDLMHFLVKLQFGDLTGTLGPLVVLLPILSQLVSLPLDKVIKQDLIIGWLL